RNRGPFLDLLIAKTGNFKDPAAKHPANTPCCAVHRAQIPLAMIRDRVLGGAWRNHVSRKIYSGPVAAAWRGSILPVPAKCGDPVLARPMAPRRPPAPYWACRFMS